MGPFLRLVGFSPLSTARLALIDGTILPSLRIPLQFDMNIAKIIGTSLAQSACSRKRRWLLDASGFPPLFRRIHVLRRRVYFLRGLCLALMKSHERTRHRLK